MSGVIRKCVWTLVMAGCGCGALAVPAPALANTGNCKSLQFGPFRVHRGFQMTLDVAPPSARSGVGQQLGLAVNIQKTYLPKGRNQYFADSEAFEYEGLGAGERATCKMSSDGTGTLSGTWGKALSLKLQLRRGPRRGQIVAHGRFDVNVHSAAFGTIRRNSVSAIEVSEPTGPPRPPSPEIAVFVATFDNYYATLHAFEYKNGLGCIDVNDTRRDAPAKGVSGQMGMQVCGDTVFSAPASLQSATFDGATPFTRGSFAFTCTGAPPGGPADGDGTLTGTLTVADPVLGPLPLVGSRGLLARPGANQCTPASATTSSSQATS